MEDLDTYEITKRLIKEGKLSEKASASVAKIIYNSLRQRSSDLAFKQDIELLKKDISHLEEKINIRLADMVTKEDQEKVFTELSATQTKLIKWVLGIALTISSALITGIYYVIKALPEIQHVIQHAPQ